jgi:hypothetical protein
MKAETALITFTIALASVIVLCWLVQSLWFLWTYLRRPDLLPKPDRATERSVYNHWEDME